MNWSNIFNPSDKQQECLASLRDNRFVLYGGARGGGKSYLLRWWLLQSLIEYYSVGLTNVRVMLACESYPVLQDRQISKINIEFPRMFGEVKKTQTDGLGYFLKEEFGGGAILLRNLDEPSKYMGAEFAAIGIDQIEKVPVETFNIIRGSMRWVGIRKPRMLGTANPGGMPWVKQYWIDRVFPKELEDRKDDFSFVQALPSDNEFLDPSYWDELNSLPERLRKAWVEGDWGVFSGQAFPTWDENKHTCEPFEIPEHWVKFRGIDWGSAKPMACLWIAKEPSTGRIYIYRELKKSKLTDRYQARLIRDMTPPQESIAASYADPSMWNTKNMADVVSSSDNEYMSEGVYLTKADNSRLNGKRKVDRLLEPLPDGRPGLIVFKTCKEFINSFPYLMLNDDGRGDPEDVNTDQDDHQYDALRYALTSYRSERIFDTIKRVTNPVWSMNNL